MIEDKSAEQFYIFLGKKKKITFLKINLLENKPTNLEEKSTNLEEKSTNLEEKSTNLNWLIENLRHKV